MGEKEEESFVEKTLRYLLKAVVFVMTLCIGIILMPILIVVLSWKMAFGNKAKPLAIPDLLSKFRK